MELDPVILSRLQFVFDISFHNIFSAFTIGPGAWLTVIEGARLATGNAVYRRVDPHLRHLGRIRSRCGHLARIHPR